MSGTSVPAAFQAVASVSDGTAVNQDAWMAQWCKTNWGNLLQPAPLSISLLGSILIIASATDDFSLVSGVPKGVPAFNWKYASHPDSFKACLQQMVGDGYKAFGGASDNMQVIQECTGQIPDVIRDLVLLIVEGNAADIESNFKNSVDDLLQLSKKARAAAQNTDAAFNDISGLAQEMVLACTYKAGTTQQALAQNTIHLQVLTKTKNQEATELKNDQATAALMQKSFTSAEEEFKSAVNSVPSGWDLMGMQVVSSLTSLAVSAGNAYISESSLKAQLVTAGVDTITNVANAETGGRTGAGVSDTTTTGTAASAPASTAPSTSPSAPASTAPSTSPSGVSTLPNSAALSDPGTMLVQRVLDIANIIKALLTGNNGGPDWNMINAKNAAGQNGAAYVETTLTAQQSQLTPGKPISTKLGPFITTALGIIAVISKAAGESQTSANNSSLEGQVQPADDLVTSLQSLLTSVNLVLQQPGAPATGPATPAPPAAPATGGAAQLAVQNASMVVNQTRSQLEASRDAFEKASDQLCKQQEQISKTISDMTQISLTDASLQKLLPVLKQAVGSFTTLRAQFAQLVNFFDSVSNLLTDVMGPSIDRWVKTLTAAEQQSQNGQEPAVAGVTISRYTRDIMYRQIMTPLKVSTLAEQIATTYLDVSTKYIMPAQEHVGNMLQFAGSDSASAQAALNAQLTKSQALLAKSTQAASTQITALVAADQKKFSATINSRLQAVINGTKLAIPAAAQPLPANLKAVAVSHANAVGAANAAQAAANPMFNVNTAV